MTFQCDPPLSPGEHSEVFLKGGHQEAQRRVSALLPTRLGLFSGKGRTPSSSVVPTQCPLTPFVLREEHLRDSSLSQ